MMLHTTLGNRLAPMRVVIGEEYNPARPIRHTAVARLRIRARPGALVSVHIKAGAAFAEHYLADGGEHYELVPTGRINVTAETQRSPANTEGNHRG